MSWIIQFFSSYVKPLTLGVMGFLGWLLYKKNNTLKVENELINRELEGANKLNEIHVKVLEIAIEPEPTDFDSRIEWMRKNL